MPFFSKMYSSLSFSTGEYLYIVSKSLLNSFFLPSLKKNEIGRLGSSVFKLQSNSPQLFLWPSSHSKCSLFSSKCKSHIQSGFQHQFHMQNLNYFSSGSFPIQFTYFCQIVTVGTQIVRVGTHLSIVTLKSFSESLFQETTPLPIDEQTAPFLLIKI